MNRSLYLVAASLFTWGVGEGMFIQFQPLYLQELGANPVMIGTILGVIGIAMTAAHLPAGYLSDRFGRRPLLWAAWCTALMATWVMALGKTLPVFVAGAVLYGATAFVAGPLSSYITAARGNLSVGRALTLVFATYNLGAILGPLAGGWIGENLGLNRSFVYAGVLFSLSTLIIFALPKQPVEFSTPGQQLGAWKSLLNRRYIQFLLVIFIAIFCMYLPQPLSQNYLQNERSLSVGQIGQLIAARSVGVVVFNILLGSLNARYGFLLAQIGLGMFTILVWQGTGFPAYLASYVMLGSFLTARSLAGAQGRALVQANQMGLAYGMLETVGSMAVVLAPPLAGMLYQSNPTLPYTFGLIGTAVSIIISIFLIPLKPSEIS
jgi:MFS family permease